MKIELHEGLYLIRRGKGALFGAIYFQCFYGDTVEWISTPYLARYFTTLKNAEEALVEIRKRRRKVKA